jgi:hypothetical protein
VELSSGLRNGLEANIHCLALQTYVQANCWLSRTLESKCLKHLATILPDQSVSGALRKRLVRAEKYWSLLSAITRRLALVPILQVPIDTLRISHISLLGCTQRAGHVQHFHADRNFRTLLTHFVRSRTVHLPVPSRRCLRQCQMTVLSSDKFVSMGIPYSSPCRLTPLDPSPSLTKFAYWTRVICYSTSLYTVIAHAPWMQLFCF